MAEKENAFSFANLILLLLLVIGFEGGSQRKIQMSQQGLDELQFSSLVILITHGRVLKIFSGGTTLKNWGSIPWKCHINKS